MGFFNCARNYVVVVVVVDEYLYLCNMSVVRLGAGLIGFK
jgi:hypothetical protein